MNKERDMTKVENARNKTQVVVELLKLAAIVQKQVKCVDNVLYCEECPLYELMGQNVDTCLQLENLKV